MSMRPTNYIQKCAWASLILMMWLLAMPTAKAQSRDTTLQEIKVKAKHTVANDSRLNDFSPGQKITTIDAATLQQYQLQSMANLLAQQVPVFVRSYGFNGLATLSFRGSSAAQSAVMWNGIPIQNAALGIADVSTMPVLFMNKVNVVYGSSAALWGSGNVGGALLLENEQPAFAPHGKTLSVSSGAGSYGQYLAGGKGSISGKRWYLSGNVFGQTARNDFAYTDANGLDRKMPNGQLKSAAAMLQAAYKISTKDVVRLSAWYQQYDREVPPALFEPASVKKQTDGSLRLLADWNRKNDKSTWYAKASYIEDKTHYRDNAISLNTNNTVHQYYQEVGWKKQFNKYGQVLIFSPVQLSWMKPEALKENKQQSKVALAAAYNLALLRNKLDIAVNGRAEQINNQGVLLAGASASFAITNWFVLRANAQRTYRAPTLNELYYNPGGNPALKPEQGWNEDAGYTVKLRVGKWAFYHDVAVFNRNIHDWVVWLGGAIWTPHNIAEVHSRGIETENKLTYTSGKWQCYLGVNTAYVLATTVSSYLPNDGSSGKQIPNTPRYNGQLNAGINYGQLTLNYNHTYTGYRFTTFDESAYLLPYQTGNVQISYSLQAQGRPVLLTAQVNNVWNETYQVTAQRPMPGTNWQAGFRVQM